MSLRVTACHCVRADQTWWNLLTPVDQNSQINITKLVAATEGTKMTEVGAWADASRQKEQISDDPASQMNASTKFENPMLCDGEFTMDECKF